MRKKKQNGFLLIEFLIIFGVISIIISIFFIKLKSIQEMKDLEESVIKISSIIDKYTFRSFETKVLYKINLDYKNKKMEIRKTSDENNNFEEVVSLPKKLTYLVPYTINGKELLIDQLEIHTTINGNLSFYYLHIELLSKSKLSNSYL